MFSGLANAKKPEQVEARVESLVCNRSLEKELEQLKAKLASAAGSDMLSQVQEVGGVKLLVTELDGVSGKDLRGVLDQLKNKLGSGVITQSPLTRPLVKPA